MKIHCPAYGAKDAYTINLLIINSFIFGLIGSAKSPPYNRINLSKLRWKTPYGKRNFPANEHRPNRYCANIQIDVSSRDDIPVILLGLQQIYTTPSLRDAVFKIMEEVAATKLDNDIEKVVSINKGRPGIDQWSILVLGALRLGLNADYDRILELVNQHRTIREMLGLGCFDTDKRYCLQTLKDNLKLLTPKVMARINVEVIQAGYRLLDLDVHAPDHGIDAFERYVALAVLSRNIQKLGTIKRDAERQRLLLEKQKRAA